MPLFELTRSDSFADNSLSFAARPCVDPEFRNVFFLLVFLVRGQLSSEAFRLLAEEEDTWMVVAVGYGRKRNVEPFASWRDCERRRSLQLFDGCLGPLDRESLRLDLGLIGCKAEGLAACCRLSLPACRRPLEVGILMDGLTGRWGEKGRERFEKHCLSSVYAWVFHG